MKRLLFVLLLFIFFLQKTFSQSTNILRDTGRAGIGTVTPAEKLEIAENGPAVAQFTNYWDVLGPVGTIRFNLAGTEVGRIETERIVPEGRKSAMKFHVWTGSELNEALRISHTGLIGIGTTSPQQKLDVTGHILSAPSPTEGAFYLGNANHGMRRLPVTNTVELFTTQGSLYLSASGINGRQMSIHNDGHVEIGTQTQTSALTVNGPVAAVKVKVKQNVWADFVFDPNYALPSLYELETFIKKHQHLPAIPTAKEVAQNGLDLGETQAKLLQKIEELTLYIIAQNKNLDALKRLVAEQDNRLKKLANSLTALENGTSTPHTASTPQ
ncbi:hypothetical protein [Chitinophaga sp.]|uniref:hypothetical protein n=1 Tax=Chitinophaga sp. TaxID=1869181 RepID=UPI0031D51E1B